MPSKAFTVAEANATLPQIESILQRIEAKKAALANHVQKLHVLDALWGSEVNDPHNPDNDEFQQHRRRVGYLKQDIVKLIEDDLLSLGVQIGRAHV